LKGLNVFPVNTLKEGGIESVIGAVFPDCVGEGGARASSLVKHGMACALERRLALKRNNDLSLDLLTWRYPTWYKAD